MNGINLVFSACKAGNSDVIFIVDGSGSVGLDNFRLELDFVTALAYALVTDHADTTGTRYGFIYSH